MEFDPPHLPWLFTPAAAGRNGRLRPWLVLVVVRDPAGTAVRPAATGPLPRLVAPVADGRKYVLRTDVPTNVVVVAPRARLGTRRLRLHDVQLHDPRSRVDAKLRYRSPAVPARVAHVPGGLELHLDQPAFGVAPGQTAALYDGDAVVGAGTIVAPGDA